MEKNTKIAVQKSGRLSFYVVNAIADGCTIVERLGSSDVAKVHQLFYSAKLLWMFLQQGLSSSVYAGAG